MNRDKYLEALELERLGEIEKAGKLLNELVLLNDPHSLVELGSRYFAKSNDDNIYWPGHDSEQSAVLIERGREQFECLAVSGDAEAMRMLGYFYLGLLGPVIKDILAAEKWLHKAYSSGCYFAANDLSTFYISSNIDLALHWYQLAVDNNCCVIAKPKIDT